MANSEKSATKFVVQLSAHLQCSLCGRLFNKPVINTRCGHTFCRRCIEARINTESCSCPLDSGHCSSSDLVLNRALEGQIEDLEIYCQYGLAWSDTSQDHVLDPGGCTQKIKLGSRKLHEEQCLFALIPCPNSEELCGKIRRNELQKHLANCSKHQCIHQDKGCDFIGDRPSLLEHQLVCGYRGFMNTEGGYGDKIRALQLENAALRTTVHVLNDKVKDLEKYKATSNRQLEQCISTLATLQEKVSQLIPKSDRNGSPSRRVPSTPVHRSFSARATSTSSLSGLSHSIPRDNWVMPFNFKCIGTLRGHQDAVWCLATKGSRLFSSGSDKSIKVWDLETLSKGCIYTMKGHIDTVHAVVCCSSIIYSAGADFSIRSWNLEGFEQVNCIQNAHDNVVCAMIHTGDYLFTSSMSVIKIWETRTLRLLKTIEGLHHWVRSLAVNPSKDKVYSGSHNTIEIWDATGKFNLKGKLDHEFGSAHSLVVTSHYIIAGTYNQNLQIFDVSSHRLVKTLQAHVGTISSLICNSTGQFLISASHDSSVQIWNLENMLPIQTLRRHEGAVNALALHGDMLLTGSADHEVKVFLLLKMQMGFIPL